jgi:hypothetical protein
MVQYYGTIYVRDMQINDLFKATACKSKLYLTKFYIYIQHLILHLPWIFQIYWWRTDALGQWPNFEAKEPKMQMAVTDMSQAKFRSEGWAACLACRFRNDFVGTMCSGLWNLLLCHAPDLSIWYSAFLSTRIRFLNSKNCHLCEEISTQCYYKKNQAFWPM